MRKCNKQYPQALVEAYLVTAARNRRLKHLKCVVSGFVLLWFETFENAQNNSIEVLRTVKASLTFSYSKTTEYEYLRTECLYLEIEGIDSLGIDLQMCRFWIWHKIYEKLNSFQSRFLFNPFSHTAFTPVVGILKIYIQFFYYYDARDFVPSALQPPKFRSIQYR